jgi:arylsulfatase A-like enzyme
MSTPPRPDPIEAAKIGDGQVHPAVGAGRGVFTVLLGRMLVLWVVLVALDLFLAVVVSSSVIHEGSLRGELRAGLVLFDLASLTVLLGAGFLIAAIAAALESVLMRRRAGPHPVSAAVFAVTALLATFFLLVSWVALLATGRFADLGGVRFWAENATQFTQHIAHMKPLWLVGAPCLSLMVVASVLLAWHHLAPRLNRRSLAGLVALPVLIAAAGGSALITLTPHENESARAVLNAATGVTYTVGDLYATTRDERAGPAARLVVDIASELAPDRDEPTVDPTIRVIRPPILPMQQYLTANATHMRRLNVIVLLVESMRADQLTGSGSSRVVMPTIEALAREGTVFTDAICQSSHSNYADICPLSSHYPMRSARPYTYPEHPTYPRVLIYDVLKAAGYHTSVFSSQNESWGGMIRYLQTGNIDTFLHSENYQGPTYLPRTDAGFTAFIAGTKRSGKIDDRFTVNEAIKWIDGLGGEPFFMYMNLQASHVPYEVPADFTPPFAVKRDFDILFGYFPKNRLHDVKDIYANSLAYLDAQFGRLVSHLREIGQYDRTVIAVTGDNGQAFYEHGFAAHAGALFQEVEHIALVIHGPGMPAAIDDRPAQHIDIPPTVFHLLGLPPHPSFQGVDLLSSDRRENRARFMVAQSPIANQYAIIRDGGKLMVDLGEHRGLLYDLRRDPGERFDLAHVDAGRAAALQRWLDTWRRVQIDYYQHIDQHSRTYPPQLDDR